MKNINNIIFFAIFVAILLLCGLSNISAANQTIDNTTSGGIAQGIVDTGAGETLFLQPGIYNKTNDYGITINKSITIQGNGSADTVIIDPQKFNRIFNINNNSIRFINITFRNGNTTGDGGAIYNSNFANIAFINCQFINNTAANYGGAIINLGNNLSVINCTFINSRASNAGAIYVMRSNFTLINSTFINNAATSSSTGYGGAIYDDGSSNSTIINTTFFNNTAQWGGAIFSWLRNGVTIINSTFTNNSANRPGGAGGAIYNEGDNYLIINSTFTNNTALVSGYGGAIINHGGNFTLINSIFTNNTAGGSGGAIYNHRITGSSNGTYNFTVMNSTFINNKAGWGGAIYNFGNNSTIINTNFINNTATNFGGAVNNNGNLTLRDSTFTDNKARNGGAIYNNINGNMSIFNNSMTGNSADLGQMIYNNGNMGILNLTYLNNSTQYVRSGQTVTLYAILTDDMGNTVTGQNIRFYVNGTSVGTSTAIEGYANLTYTVNGVLGDILPVTGTYAGNGSYPIVIRNGELIIMLLTNSTINAPDGKVGKPITILGVATDEDGNPIANTQITISISGKTYNVTTNSNGEWSFTFTPTSTGNFTTTISWTGNSTHRGFTNSTTFNVVKIPTIITVIAPNTELGKTINIHGILVDEDGKPIANTLITVTIDGKKYTVTTDENGLWNLPYKTTHTGNIEVSVSFEGNNVYLASQNTTIFNVKANNQTNQTNQTNETNETNNTNNNLNSTAAMKKTGMPIIPILILLISVFGISIRRKQR